jgi:hypothetical protein
MDWILRIVAAYVVITIVCMLIGSKRRGRAEKRAEIEWGIKRGGFKSMAINDADGDIRIPCPTCGKRLTDAKGHTCYGDFEMELKCPNTRSCGLVTINAQYIANFLDKRHR